MPQATEPLSAPRPDRISRLPFEPRFGTLRVRGWAHLPEHCVPPTGVKGATFTNGPCDRVDIPSGTITWDGESFEARWDNIGEHPSEAKSALAEVLFDAGCITFGMPSTAWVGGSQFEDRSVIRGFPGSLICEDGHPVSVEITSLHPEDFEYAHAMFQRVFAGLATLGPWRTSEPDQRGYADARADVTWYGPKPVRSRALAPLS